MSPEPHKQLAAIDKRFAPVIKAIGPYAAKRRNPDGHFGALVRSIVYQQLAGAAAAAIHGRFRLLIDGKLTPEAVLAVPEEALAAAGLSRAKRASIRDLAAKVSDGTVPLQRISRFDDEAIIERLVTVRGIGRWTAEMFLLFQLGRMDVWPVDDLGVREGWRLIQRLPERPTPKALFLEGERYRPIRSVAAWYCWQAVHIEREAVKGRDVLLEVLASEGVRHVFGNPGTTELPFVDSLAGRDDPAYVLALQEATAVGMADGYAQATGRPAFLNLHTSAGLGNAIGNLTNAQANATPLVVTAGQQDRRHIVADPLLAGDLVGLARPVSKWAHEVRTVGELGTIMRRAFHDAPTAPAGPVFVSLPMDLLEEETDAAVPPPSRIERRTVPAALDELTDALASIDWSELAIVAADEVAASGAVEALVAVAEALGCAVFGAPLHSNVVFPVRHPLWRGDLAPAAASINRALAPFRRVLFVGGRAFMVYPYTPGPALPPELELLHLSPDPHQLGRTWPTTLGLQGDPKASLEALLPMLTAQVDHPALDASEADARAASLEDKARARYDDMPMHPMAAAHALVRALPPDAIVVDEAVTTGTYVRGFHHVAAAGRYFFCRGGGLGWGMPAALGVSLGFDRQPVLCVVGDGSAMYSPQALWTAARERLPVVFAVVNNRQYLILKNALRTMEGDSAAAEHFVGMDIIDPPVDFVALARSMGVSATLVDRTADVGDAVRAAWDTGEPHLLELPISVPS